MKIVIEIPEATYEMIKEMQKRNGTEYMNELESGVANGTPLAEVLNEIEGDIEDYYGDKCLTCPWLDRTFDED